MGTENFGVALARKLIIILFVAALTALGFGGVPARAAADGARGWGAVGNYYPSAVEACRAYWNYYVAGKGISRFIGATIVDVGRAECEYTHYLHLCPEESGGGAFDCNTILPVDVFYECQLVGYHLSDAGRCVADRVREPMQCDEPDGQFGGNPILFVSGSKTETRTDFATADGRLSVQRFYRSLKQRWHSLAALNSAFNAEPLGQVGGWGFGFAMEWHLEKTRIALSSSNPGGALYLPDGTAHHYAYHSGFTPNSHNPNSKYKVEFVGVLPSVWSTLFDVSSQWRVTDLNDWPRLAFEDVCRKL